MIGFFHVTDGDHRACPICNPRVAEVYAEAPKTDRFTSYLNGVKPLRAALTQALDRMDAAVEDLRNEDSSGPGGTE